MPQLLSLMQAASSGQQLCLSNCQMGHQATVVVAHCAGKELFGIQLIVQRDKVNKQTKIEANSHAAATSVCGLAILLGGNFSAIFIITSLPTPEEKWNVVNADKPD